MDVEIVKTYLPEDSCMYKTEYAIMAPYVVSGSLHERVVNLVETMSAVKSLGSDGTFSPTVCWPMISSWWNTGVVKEMVDFGVSLSVRHSNGNSGASIDRVACNTVRQNEMKRQKKKKNKSREYERAIEKINNRWKIKATQRHIWILKEKSKKNIVLWKIFSQAIRILTISYLTSYNGIHGVSNSVKDESGRKQFPIACRRS